MRLCSSAKPLEKCGQKSRLEVQDSIDARESNVLIKGLSAKSVPNLLQQRMV